MRELERRAEEMRMEQRRATDEQTVLRLAAAEHDTRAEAYQHERARVLGLLQARASPPQLRHAPWALPTHLCLIACGWLLVGLAHAYDLTGPAEHQLQAPAGGCGDVGPSPFRMCWL